jgi:hypothetical protein
VVSPHIGKNSRQMGVASLSFFSKSKYMYKKGEKVYIIKLIDDKRYFDKYEVVSVEDAKDNGCWLTGINQLGNQTTRWYNNSEFIKSDSIVESLVNQLRDRSAVGMAKYNTNLDRNDLTIKEWVEHAKQEAMDLALYLEKIKQML